MKNKVVESMIRQQLNIGIDIDVVVLFTYFAEGIYYFDITWYTEEVDKCRTSIYRHQTNIGLPSIKVKSEKLAVCGED